MDYSKLGKQFIGGNGVMVRAVKHCLTSIHIMMRSLRLFKSRALQTLMMPIRSYQAKLEWDKVNPYRKRDILENAVKYIESHEEDITSIIVQELGGTRLKAAFEIGLVKNMIKEAATFPSEWRERFYLPLKMARRTDCIGSRLAWLVLSVHLTFHSSCP